MNSGRETENTGLTYAHSSVPCSLCCSSRPRQSERYNRHEPGKQEIYINTRTRTQLGPDESGSSFHASVAGQETGDGPTPTPPPPAGRHELWPHGPLRRRFMKRKIERGIRGRYGTMVRPGSHRGTFPQIRSTLGPPSIPLPEWPFYYPEG